MTQTQPRPIVLIILDGFGYRETKEHNAIAAAHTPTWNKLWEQYPHTILSGSGLCVGLPEGQMGNSEVGHLTMGAGRIIHQDLTRINLMIESGEFNQNAVLHKAFANMKQTGKALHLMGLVSSGGVHSHEAHIHAVIKLAAAHHIDQCYIHAFLDGRDTPPQSAIHSLKALASLCEENKTGKIVSLIGRYYAMDRDQRWERVESAYDLLTSGIADYHAEDALTGLAQAYQRGESDEFVKATVIHDENKKPTLVEEGDMVIFMNFRADRARELTKAFIDKDFPHFKRKKHPNLSQFISLTQYHASFKHPVIFSPIVLKNLFGEYISKAGLTQLRLAETEKYAHVTFFFNGGIEQPANNEQRMLIPSPKVATYDLQPEMSAYPLTEKLIEAIHSQQYDVIICNYANPDMVGHTGNFAATVKAIEVIDECLEKIVKALEIEKGEMIITADHGNAEKMYDEEHHQPHTAHTCDPVPFIYYGRFATINNNNGNLSDIAPTLLYLLGLNIPIEMTGKSLINFRAYP